MGRGSSLAWVWDHLSHLPFPLEVPPWRKTFLLRGPSWQFQGVPPGRLSSPDSASTRNLLQNRGVESSGRPLWAEIWPSLPLPGHFPATSRPLPGHFPATWRLWRPPLGQVPKPLEGPRRVSLPSPGGTSHEFGFCLGSTLLRIWGPKEPTIADHHNIRDLIGCVANGPSLQGGSGFFPGGRLGRFWALHALFRGLWWVWLVSPGFSVHFGRVNGSWEPFWAEFWKEKW